MATASASRAPVAEPGLLTRLLAVPRFDAVGVLTVEIALVIAIPSNLVFGPLGSAGTPAQILNLLLLLFWAVIQARRVVATDAGRQPVRFAMFAFVACVTVSFIIETSNPLDSTASRNGVGMMVGLLAMTGLLLFANDGVTDQDRLETLLRRLVFAVACLAALGMVQFVTGHLIVDHLWFPGLRANTATTAIDQRGGLNRIFGTSISPIEFGSVLTMTLPLALTLAMTDSPRSAVRRWAPPLLIALAVTVSISRSAILSAVISLIVMAPVWPKEVLRRAAVGAIGFGAMVALMVPGMVGTTYKLFSKIGSDASASSRSDSYPIAISYIDRAPLFGRGFGTFLPEYHILDNAYLGLAIEVGFVGLFALCALLLTGMAAGQGARVASPARSRASYLGHSLTASIVAGALGLALYDGLSFPQGAVVLFLMLGIAGAARRIALADAARRDSGLKDDGDPVVVV
jgi:O-antigen ligase